MNTNYPQGTSRRDLVKGGIIQPHDHQHEFEPDNSTPVVFTPLTAVIVEECIYTEGERRTDWSCDETHEITLEIDHIIKKRRTDPNIKYNSDFIRSAPQLRRKLKQDIEYSHPEIVNMLNRDEDGFITAETRNHILHYTF